MYFDFRGYIQKHPLSFIVGLVIAVAGLTGTLVTFLMAKTADLQAAKNALVHQQKINDYEIRLASIQRTVGDDSVYFDISKALISRQDARKLPAYYKEVLPGLFFANAPLAETWEELIMDEYTLDSNITPWLYADMHPQMIESLRQTLLHIWRNETTFHVECKFRFSAHGECEFNLYPLILVTKIDKAEAEARRDLIAESVLEALGGDDIDGEDTAASTHEEDTQEEPGAKVSQIMKVLDELYDREMAMTIMLGKINSGMAFSQRVANSAFNIETMQKKGNVLYIQSEYIIRESRIRIKGAVIGSTIYLNMEDFFIGTKDNGVLIRVMIPSLDGRSEAHKWVERWLSDFKVVI